MIHISLSIVRILPLFWGFIYLLFIDQGLHPLANHIIIYIYLDWSVFVNREKYDGGKIIIFISFQYILQHFARAKW